MVCVAGFTVVVKKKFKWKILVVAMYNSFFFFFAMKKAFAIINFTRLQSRFMPAGITLLLIVMQLTFQYYNIIYVTWTDLVCCVAGRDIGDLVQEYDYNRMLLENIPSPHYVVIPTQLRNRVTHPISTKEHRLRHHVSVVFLSVCFTFILGVLLLLCNT